MAKTRVVVVGAGGIIGQHLCISVPATVEAVFTRLHGGGIYRELDLCGDFGKRLDEWEPDVVVNLAGESRVDEVEKSPAQFRDVNVGAVDRLVKWCNAYGKRLIHVSSQAVIGPRVNEYGRQKYEAEQIVVAAGYVILRPTFVLGIRPFSGIGRENPAERILSGRETRSVYDRFFSVSFAWDVAEAVWLEVLSPSTVSPIQIGNPERQSRYSVAVRLGTFPERVKHDTLGLAQRPLDTTYIDPWHKTLLDAGMERLKREYMEREEDTLEYRAEEIAAFLQKPWEECLAKLQTGFGSLHAEVTADFNRVNPKTDEELLAWYRGTEAYIYELTVYHCDAGFNYTGMCKGIAEALTAKGVERVLCLGDGIGDLSLVLHAAGMKVMYHDLYLSKTAEFASARFRMRLGDTGIGSWMTAGFAPIATPEELALALSPHGDLPPVFYDAIVSLDFLEHVPNVEAWVRAIYANLKPGGWLMTQNAFNIGSGPEGSMPMHLSINDHYEKDWDPLLSSIGFVQESSNWYRRPE